MSKSTSHALDPSGMSLSPCTDQDLVGVFRWFNSEKAVFYWGGPDISYPLQIKRFKTQSKYHKSQSYVLKQGRTLLAFGQIYNRLDHCHLGRLVVSPKFRGQGVGVHLIEALLQAGQDDLNLDKGSLFVLSDNTSAMKLYEKVGFEQREYPVEIPLENCLYMTRSEKP
ncbi:GNAT family N-acetyltransferase [Marinicella sp. S1101]|uniref:GNAT family N-acetyltransferase n=1 Tax=Marinicella marina TaxID=2996016 RepID=UPI002260E547|nr:GNAT family N-acetyltransferase [Marinicella marina]MCX7553054.1 GNAT family N-acetyltransferase [Marinicella marina]MDJ1139586.1 GNAT family N-acetyltransferase [Marinicella marina]